MSTSETAETQAGPVKKHDLPLVSIVIPAFNEASRIGQSLDQIAAFLDRTPLSLEIIVVDDGSTDRTSDVVLQSQLPGLRLIRNDRNHGKGYSVRQGTLNATATYVLFTDADLSAPIDELDKLFDVATRENADVVIGSRAIDRKFIEKHQSQSREAGGILFNRAMRLLLGLKIHDTQCGFKLFQREKSLWVFERQTIEGFGFDPELLFLAARHGLRIREVPVRWSHSEGTKVRFLRDGVGMFFDLLRIRWNAVSGKYS